MIDLPLSVDAYRPQAEAILEWAKDGWLDQDEFDRRADGWSSPSGKTMAMWFRPESILLPSVWPGKGQRDDFIAIAQALMAAKLLRARKRRGRIEYRTEPPLSVAA